MTLRLVSHPLPVAWDGCPVKWGRWQTPVRMHVCPPPKERCECGSTRPPFTAVGLRATGVKGERFARRLAMRDLRAFRCPDCGEVDVWDMKSDEWWRLDESDYGPAGSEPPGEWTGGLFDLLPNTRS